MPESKERLDPEPQVTGNTTLTAKEAGELTGTSLARIDHAIRGFFGTLAIYVLMLTDEAVRLAGGGPEPIARPWTRAPVARVLLRDPNGANSRHVTEFYDLLRKARTAGATLRVQPDAEAARRYAEQHRDELRFLGSGNRAAGVMAELRKRNERIERSRDYTPEQKLDLVSVNNARIRAIARDINAQH